MLTGCCNGFKIGTKTVNGFENITFSNSILHNVEGGLGSRLESGVSLEVVDGGWVDGVVISGIQMQRVRAPIHIRRGDRSKPFQYSQTGLRGVLITGVPRMPVEDVSLSDIHIETVMPGKREWVKNPVPEVADAYPQSRMFGWLPASGLYCRHVDGLRMRSVSFSAPGNEWRPTLICDDISSLKVAGFDSSPVSDGVPVIELSDVDGGWISRVAAPVGSKSLLAIQGPQSNNILISGCDHRKAGKLAEIAAEVPAGAIRDVLNIGK
jgi:hypothetical protein